jgi:hypothetical protein
MYFVDATVYYAGITKEVDIFLVIEGRFVTIQ